MKKVITIVMIICIMLCGCDKAETTNTPTSEPTTTAPTKEPTQAPTQEPTQAPTEVPTETPVADTEPRLICELCGDDGVLYECTMPNTGNKYILCNNCYLDVERYYTDVQTYSNVIGIAEIALATKEAYLETVEKGDVYINIGKDGLSYDNAGDEFLSSIDTTLKKVCGDDYKDTLYTNQECVIRITDGSVSAEKRPINPVDSLEK